jgi:hypothetical protein
MSTELNKRTQKYQIVNQLDNRSKKLWKSMPPAHRRHLMGCIEDFCVNGTDAKCYRPPHKLGEHPSLHPTSRIKYRIIIAHEEGCDLPQYDGVVNILLILSRKDLEKWLKK